MTGLTRVIVLMGLFLGTAWCDSIPRVISYAKGIGKAAEQAGDGTTATAEGLRSQIEAILRAAGNGDPKQLKILLDDLQVPESANWFTATFGEERGRELAAAYKNSWPVYESSIETMFRAYGMQKHGRAFVKEHSAPAPVAGYNFIQTILENARGPLVLYTAGAGKKREDSSLPGGYVYVQGKFRIVNWRTFYGLPNVKVMRIRVGSEVAASQLVRQVNPVLPDEASRKKVQGIVVLRVIIDRDGTVAQVVMVSGAQELIKAAEEAVRQWRYRPTLLDGDPVEVDTNVTIAFSLGH